MTLLLSGVAVCLLLDKWSGVRARPQRLCKLSISGFQIHDITEIKLKLYMHYDFREMYRFRINIMTEIMQKQRRLDSNITNFDPCK